MARYRHYRPAMLALLVTLALVVPVQNQPPANDPGLTSPTVEDKRREQEHRRINNTPISPTTAVSPQAAPAAVPGVQLDVPAGRHYPEGAFFPSRVGRLVRTPRGDVIFAPAAIPGGRAEPPLVLQQCATLAQLLAAVGTAEPAVSVSGQVFVYRGRHYLLPTAFALADAPSTEAAPAPAPPAPILAGAEDPDPAVAELIRELEARPGPPRAIDPAPAPTDDSRPGRRNGPPGYFDAAGDVAGAPAEEGALLVSRRGRLVRLAAADGRYAVAFDNDPDSPSAGVMVLLPCRALERLEGLAAQRGENVAFSVSGRVFAYEGRGYLLPVLVQPQPVGDLAPRQ